MKNRWKKPSLAKVNNYQKEVIGLVPEGNLIKSLEVNETKLLKLVKNLPAKKLAYRYAKDKWSIPEIMMHLIDCERVFTYRILCISRGDTNPLPSFDHEKFMKGIDVKKIDFKKILKEYKAVRKSTIYLLKHLNDEMFMRKGIANNTETSAQRIAYFMVGHEMHHLDIIKKKYL